MICLTRRATLAASGLALAAASERLARNGLHLALAQDARNGVGVGMVPRREWHGEIPRIHIAQQGDPLVPRRNALLIER